MTMEEITDLLNPACKVAIDCLHQSYVCVGDARKLDDLIGIPAYHDYELGDRNPISDELKSLYQKLAGPHGKAILKAYRIQKGLE